MYLRVPPQPSFEGMRWTVFWNWLGQPVGFVQAYYSVFSPEKRVWEQLGAVWSTAARMTGKVYQVGEPPDFLKLMDGSVAQLALKPVRARRAFAWLFLHERFYVLIKRA